MQMYDVYLILPNYLARKTDIFLVLTKKLPFSLVLLKNNFTFAGNPRGEIPWS